MFDKYDQLIKGYNGCNAENIVAHSKVLLDQIKSSLDLMKISKHTEANSDEENNTKKTDTIQTLKDFAEYNYYCMEQIANCGKRSLYDFDWWKHQEFLQSQQSTMEQVSPSN